MKKGILVLVMITIAATAYNQSSRRTTNVNTNTSSRNSSRATVYASNTNSGKVTRSNSRTTTQSNNHRDNTISQRHNSNKHTKSTYHKNHSNNKHKVHYNYRSPAHVNVIWTSDMHKHYVNLYPSHKHWNRTYGHRISSIPAREANYYVGDVRNVYGKITDVYYSRETDEYLLYIGRHFPYQHFTVVVPGNVARRQSHRPSYYFNNQYINVTGLISTYEGKPEIVVMRNSQLNIY